MASISILGAGNWGTTLAILLHSNGQKVNLWEFRPKYAERLRSLRENKESLPGVLIPSDIFISSHLQEVVRGAEIIVFAVPSHVLREVAKGLAKIELDLALIVSVVKGLENNTLLRMSQVLEEELPPKFRDSIAVLSGPTIATEVCQGIPTAVVVAAREEKVTRKVQSIFMAPTFRVYTNGDVIGVELGGALKNVIAIAAGIIDGLGFGANTKGALLTRGLAEIARLGIKMGAQEVTFAGLSGIGDLIATCFSMHSRNRYVGEEHAKGIPLPEILSSMVMVAEGVKTTKAAYELSQRFGVEMPITHQVYRVLFEGHDPRLAVSELMLREATTEIWR